MFRLVNLLLRTEKIGSTCLHKQDQLDQSKCIIHYETNRSILYFNFNLSFVFVEAYFFKKIKKPLSSQ